MKTNTVNEQGTPPGWKFGHVWLVIAGPAVVVVAGITTLFIAVLHPDPVLAGDHFKRAEASAGTQVVRPALAPAMQGRNHAATAAPGDAR